MNARLLVFPIVFSMIAGFAHGQDVEGLGDPNATVATARFEIGADLKAVPQQLQVDLLLKPKEGLYVASVGEGSAAAKAGVKKGDVIYKIGDQDLKSMNQFILAANAAGAAKKELALSIFRGAEIKSISVTPTAKEGAPASVSDNPFATKPK
ncbi:MAG: PDZ domain-containing protein [Verrucomicrobiota bacterium]